jgi:hypothetical protein
MRSFLQRFTRRFIKFAGSRTALWLIIGLFTIQAIWLALTSRYPMAFDENFHLGLIRIYADHWLPFLGSQPPHASVYGSVATDPSYLYHYLMSFPYRFIRLFTDDVPLQVIALRFINIGIVVAALLTYARLLRFTPLSAAKRHALLFFFTAIPVLPVVAGQIDYDGLFLLMSGVVAGLALAINARLQHGKLHLPYVYWFVVFGLLGCLVKYAFLPVLAGATLYLLVVLFMHVRSSGTDIFRSAWRQQVASLSRLRLVIMLIVLLAAGGLFLQRYGLNTVRYHNPIPDCGQVLTVDECEQYAPWGRDYRWSADNEGRPRDSVVVYSYTWIKHLMRELFFAVYAAFIGSTTIVGYWGEDPIPVLEATGWVVLITGTVLSIIYAKRLWRHTSLRLLLTISAVYTLALFYQNYKMYLHVDVAVAIHGRYVLPIIPFLLVWFVMAARELLSDAGRKWVLVKRHIATVQVVVFVLLALICLQGGGVTTHLVRGADKWYWQHREPGIQANRQVKAVLKTFIFE